MIRCLRYILLFLSLSPVALFAQDSTPTMDEEIDYLIKRVGRNGCAFIRNDERYSGGSARAHLRSKRRLNAAIIHSTEEFIEKLASGSVTSGEEYFIRCRGQEPITANTWFKNLLIDYRASAND